MCIIAGEVTKVADTKIVVAALGGGKQLTVYSNTVGIASNPVAMILPFPGTIIDVAVVKTKESDNIVFDDLNKCFPTSISNYEYSITNSSGPYLEVRRSGSYRYSVAGSIDDLKRADPSVFNLNPELITVLSVYQERDFSFIVCIIDQSATYSPFAYITKQLKLNAANVTGTKLFVPTKHFHEHYSNKRSNYTWQTAYLANEPEKRLSNDLAEDWDHEIYLIGSLKTNSPAISNLMLQADRPFNDHAKYSWSNLWQKDIPPEHLHRIKIRGTFRNIDITVDVVSDYPDEDTCIVA